jgi:hypothetical protein
MCVQAGDWASREAGATLAREGALAERIDSQISDKNMI